MALSVIELAGALRVGDGAAAPPEPQRGVLMRLLKVARETIDKRAPAAPDAVKDEACIRMAGYLYDAPESASGDRFAAAFRNSGAYALLSPWAGRRAGSI